MRALAVLTVVAVAVSAGSASATRVSTHTSLTVTYWENGNQSARGQTWTVRCNPARGTRRPVVACRKLAAGGPKLFARVPLSAVCTEIYGGPQEARVVGWVQGKRIWATFGRTNGCHISRWNRLSPWLLPPGGAS